MPRLSRAWTVSRRLKPWSLERYQDAKRNHFQTWADSPPTLFYLARPRGSRSSRSPTRTILEGPARRRFPSSSAERHDGLTAGERGSCGRFVRDSRRSGRGRDRVSSLRTRHRRAEQQDCDEAKAGFEGANGEFFHDSPLSREFVFNNKKPHETPWLPHRSFSRRARPSAAWEGGLAYGFSADYSGGTAADSHGLPRYPCLQIEIRV